MNILLTVILCLICLGLGWTLGVSSGRNIEEMVEGAEQAVKYIENMETPDIDMMNMTLNQNRDANAVSDINILLSLEKGKTEKAKEILINGLASDYLDIKEDDAHEMRSLESKNVIQRIEKLAEEHESFRTVIKESGWVE